MRAHLQEEFLDSVYVEPLRSGRFTHALDLLGREFGCSRAVLMVRDIRDGSAFGLLHSSTFGIDEQSARCYYEDHWRADPIRQHLEQLSANAIIFEDHPVRRAFDTPQRRQATAEISGIEYSTTIGASVLCRGSVRAMLAVARTPGDVSTLSPLQRRSFVEDLRHLERGVAAFMVCEANLLRKFDEASLAGSVYPAWLVDGKLKVRYMNAAAGVYLPSQSEIAVVGDRLYANDTTAQLKLARLVVDALSPMGVTGQMNLKSHPRRSAAVMTCIPMVSATSPGVGQSLALLLASNVTKDESIAPHRFAARFGLTAAESSVAEKLCEGHPAKRIASRSGVAESTVRAQIQTILRKTGTCRRIELVALLIKERGVK